MTATDTTATTTATTEVKVTVAQKFPEVARLYSVADVAKLTGMAGQTITTYVMTSVAPAPSFLVGDPSAPNARMVWEDLAVWTEWIADREAARVTKEAERIARDAATFAKIDPASRTNLLKTLLSQMSPEEIVALGIVAAEQRKAANS